MSAGQRPTIGTGGGNVAQLPAGSNRPSTGPSGSTRPGAGTPPVAATLPSNVNRPGGGGNRPGDGNGGGGNGDNRPGGGGNRPTPPTPGTPPGRPPSPPSYYPPPIYVGRPPIYIGNPGPAWGWNRGYLWAPAPYYWGGGFWGPFGIGVATTLVFGTIVNQTTHQTITSYEVQPQSPGATLLANYGLTQTPCGPPELVIIYGPNDSVICAQPNSMVAAGNYYTDESNLSLVSN